MKRSSGLRPGNGLSRHKGLETRVPLRQVSEKRQAQHARTPARRDTGFSPSVRAMIRERASWRCEACGVYLGEYGGQIQHRRARGRGGSRDPLTNSPANAGLLCGTPDTGCHGLCERRDEHMREAGWWIPSWASPLAEPVMLHGNGSGVTVWLAEDGTYAFRQEAEVAP